MLPEGSGSELNSEVKKMSANPEAVEVEDSGCYTLHWAIRNGRVDAVFACIQAGISVNSVDCLGRTPLILATETNQLDCVKLLLSLRADVNFFSRSYGTALYVASRHGNPFIMSQLLQEGADVNMYGPDGKTCLFVASFEGHLSAVQLLIRAGASVHACKGTGLTPVHASVIRGHETIARFLIKHHPNLVNRQDSKGNVPLHYAVRKKNLAIIRTLLFCGSARNPKNSANECPVHIAVKIGHLPSLKLLVHMGCRADSAKFDGSSAIHSLVSKYSNKYPADFRLVLETLLLGGCDINSQAFNTLETPLYRAISLSKPDIAEILLSYGASPNLSSPFDVTALNLAYKKQFLHVCLMMLYCGIEWRREKWLKILPFHNPSQDTTNFLSILSEWIRQPPSLLNLSRVAFRKFYGSGSNLFSILTVRNDVPSSVKNFVMLCDLRNSESKDTFVVESLWKTDVEIDIDEQDMSTFETRKLDMPDLV